MFTTAIKYLCNHPELITLICFGVFSFISNVVQFVQYLRQGKIKEAITILPEVIRAVEDVYKTQFGNAPGSNYKKAMAESICQARFGRIYTKNKQLFDDAIEDILNTPQKKGGSVDVSQKN